MFLLWQAAEVSQNWLDQDSKHIEVVNNEVMSRLVIKNQNFVPQNYLSQNQTSL